MHLNAVSIERFKTINSTSFDLGPITVVVGSNNSGKSSVIQGIHFAFSLLQSMSISQKWPAKTKRSSTMSPSELIYVPSDDPYSLGAGGKLLEDAEKAIILEVTFSTGERLRLAIRKGRITNIIVEPDNIELAQQNSSLETPFSIFSPGLAGVSRNEVYVSDGVLLRALARGDANIVLRNIMMRLRRKPEWQDFENDLSEIFPQVTIDIGFKEHIDEYIMVNVMRDGNTIPLDLAGTGLLQTVQILSYFHLFAPKIILLDEPDSHLHPNNQRLLCALLSKLSEERNVQVIMTTHSRHVLEAVFSESTIIWMQNGVATPVRPEDEVEILLDLGALDLKERVQTGKYDLIFLTEDKNRSHISAILQANGFSLDKTCILSYGGVTSIHSLNPMIKHIKDVSHAKIVVHRDRDYLYPDEVKVWEEKVRAIGGEPFVTRGTDVEAYFANKEYLKKRLQNISEGEIDRIFEEVSESLSDQSIADYVNGRIDIERKNGNAAKIDSGKIAAEAAAKVGRDALPYIKGKSLLARLRAAFKEQHNQRISIEVLDGPLNDPSLRKIAEKVWRVAR